LWIAQQAVIVPSPLNNLLLVREYAEFRNKTKAPMAQTVVGGVNTVFLFLRPSHGAAREMERGRNISALQGE